MRINVGFLWAKFLRLINRPALRDCRIDKRASIGSGSNCINVSMGKYSYTGKNNSMVNVQIGAFCSIASYCAIGGGGHSLKAVSTSTAFMKGRNAFGVHFAEFKDDKNKKVIIGNDVWIGEGAFIHGGIQIGDGAIIGAHSVVTHDVEPYSIVAGAPAREIRKRFDDESIKGLLELKWWEWSDKKIERYGCFFEEPSLLLNSLKDCNEPICIQPSPDD